MKKTNIKEDLDTVEKIAKDFFQNILLGLFNPNTFKILDQGSQNEKKIYMVEIKKIFIKYESSVYRNTYLDAKDLLLIMEYCKKPASLLIKIKLMDLTMTIENGDELIHLIQEVNNNFPLINVDIDEAKKVFIKINIPFLGSSSGFFANVIIAIDSLMILATKIYINCIRTIFYYKSTKDDIFKYPLFGVMMKEVVDVHKKEIKYNCPKLKKWN